MKGTFERTAAGLRRLQAAARAKGAPLKVSINTTVTRESLEALDRMADVAEELGVDALGVNHLMYATPDEVDQTLKILGETDRRLIATFVTADPGVSPAAVAAKMSALDAACRERRIRFDYRPKVHQQLIEGYYTPGTPLRGRCLYPFLNARVGFSGKVVLLPVHPDRGGRPLGIDARGSVERPALRRPAAEAPGARAVSRVPAMLQGGAVPGAGAGGSRGLERPSHADAHAGAEVVTVVARLGSARSGATQSRQVATAQAGRIEIQ